jgi:hypothetical protein
MFVYLQIYMSNILCIEYVSWRITLSALFDPVEGGSTTLQRDVFQLPFPKIWMAWEGQKHGLEFREHENISGASKY